MDLHFYHRLIYGVLSKQLKRFVQKVQSKWRESEIQSFSEKRPKRENLTKSIQCLGDPDSSKEIQRKAISLKREISGTNLEKHPKNRSIDFSSKLPHPAILTREINNFKEHRHRIYELQSNKRCFKCRKPASKRIGCPAAKIPNSSQQIQTCQLHSYCTECLGRYNIKDLPKCETSPEILEIIKSRKNLMNAIFNGYKEKVQERKNKENKPFSEEGFQNSNWFNSFREARERLVPEMSPESLGNPLPLHKSVIMLGNAFKDDQIVNEEDEEDNF